MGHRIVLDEIALEQELQNTLDELYMLYHYHQSDIQHFDDKTNEETTALNYIGLGGGSSSTKTGTTAPPMVQYRGVWYYKGANGMWTHCKTYIHPDGVARPYPPQTSNCVKWILYALIVVGLIVGILIGYGVIKAAPAEMGDPPIPVIWENTFLEFYWANAAVNGDSYSCSYDLSDDQGVWVKRYASVWLIGAGGVYIADFDWNFSNNLWYITNIYCDAKFGSYTQVSPRNQNIYRKDFRHLVFVPMVRRR